MKLIIINTHLATRTCLEHVSSIDSAKEIIEQYAGKNKIQQYHLDNLKVNSIITYYGNPMHVTIDPPLKFILTQ